MSIGGPSALGTLLVQRLDAVLGTTLSQQTNLVAGARPDAVSQPGDAEKAEAGRNELVRHPREAVDRTQGRIPEDGRIQTPSTETERSAGTGRAATDTAATPSAPTRLGSTARIILALLLEFADHAPPINARAALFDPANGTAGAPAGGASAPKAGPAAASGVAPPAAPAAVALARALSQALETSGVFYESHLADVAFGTRTAETLLREPQALLTPRADTPTPQRPTATPADNRGPAPQAATAASTIGGTPAPEPSTAATAPGHADNTPPAPSQLSATLAPGRADASSSAPSHSSAPSPSSPATGLPAEAHLIVRQQLETLANQAIAWEGPVWPGASMHWLVRRQPDSADDAPSPPPGRWATRIRITLPRLGPVDANLQVAGSRIEVRLNAPAGAPELKSQIAALRSRLLAAGLAPGGISVSRAPGTAAKGDSAESAPSDEEPGHVA